MAAQRGAGVQVVPLPSPVSQAPQGWRPATKFALDFQYCLERVRWQVREYRPRSVSPPAQQHHAVTVAVTCTAASAPAHRRTWHKPDCNFAHPRWASGEYENWTPDSDPILNQGGGNHAHLDVCSRYVLCCKTCFSQVGLSNDCFANPYSGKIGAKSAPASLHLSCSAARRLSNGSLAVLHRFYACAKCQCRIL